MNTIIIFSVSLIISYITFYFYFKNKRNKEKMERVTNKGTFIFSFNNHPSAKLVIDLKTTGEFFIPGVMWDELWKKILKNGVPDNITIYS